MSDDLLIDGSGLHAWKERIEAAWQRSVASVIDVGRLIKQAKVELGVSFSLLETELPFSSTVAAFLVKIAEHPVLSNPAYHPMLPNGYNTLYHLAGIDETTLVRQLESGQITPNFTLVNAKLLKAASPEKLKTGALRSPPSVASTKYEVGTLSIGDPVRIDEFEADLRTLLQKYSGSITVSRQKCSLFDWHTQVMHQEAVTRIEKAERELSNISLEDIRTIEDAAHFLQKDQSQKNKEEISINGKMVTRTCLPRNYKDFEKLELLIGCSQITRGLLKHWCIKNKVPTQFTEVSAIDKDIHVWEQVRLICEKKDVKGGTKRLKDLASKSTNTNIRKLAERLLMEMQRFDNKVQ